MTTSMASVLSEGRAAVPRHTVGVVASTWTRESHDLFDFESDHIQSEKFSVQRSTTIVRNALNVSTHEDGMGMVGGS